jgi:hypothetical protein
MQYQIQNLHENCVETQPVYDDTEYKIAIKFV